MEELDEICQLHRVKTLELKSLFDPVLSVIDHSVIIGWVKRTPALGTLIVSSTLNPSSNSQLSSFFAHVKHIQHLSLCLRFKPENQDMFLTLADAKVRKFFGLELEVCKMQFLNLDSLKGPLAKYGS